jgi:hypothetical protein
VESKGDRRTELADSRRPVRRSSARAGLVLLAAGFALLVATGLAVFAGALNAEREVAAMARWRSADGTLRRVDLVPEPGGRRGTTPGWAIVLDYRWEADGVPRQGDRLAVGRRWTELRAEADAWVSALVGHDAPLTRLHGGGERRDVSVPVVVWFDPADPSRAVLDRRDWGGPRDLARATGAGFLLVGLVGLALVGFGWLRGRRQ